jgi:predicted  nucleic acid-binding Zn-ribbon protein
MTKVLRKAHEIKEEISALRSEISDLYNRSQWASTSALDAFDNAIESRENEIKALYEELEKIEAIIKA